MNTYELDSSKHPKQIQNSKFELCKPRFGTFRILNFSISNLSRFSGFRILAGFQKAEFRISILGFRIFLLVVFLHAWTTNAISSPSLDPKKTINQYVHDVWTADNGLPQNSVQAIAQTADGYL